MYSKRLEGNNIATHLKELEDDVNTLCEVRVETSKQNKATEWSMKDLKEAQNISRKTNPEILKVIAMNYSGERLLEVIC